MYSLKCLECEHKITVVVRAGPDGLEPVVLPSTYSGLATEGTPDTVSYYLDQAQRAQSIGARSAAVAMYRSALEHLLDHQGFPDRMLGPKIKQLEEASPPPVWFKDLDADYLKVMSKLGNAAIHPHGDGVAAQQTFDSAFLREIEALFVGLLDGVYEAPARRAAHLARLKDGLGAFDKKA